MTTTAHLERLNAPQRKAVTHGEALPEQGYRAGPLLIVAGAGFALHVLWWVAIAALIVWLIGFFVRRA